MREAEKAAFDRLEAWSICNSAKHSPQLHTSAEIYSDDTTGFSLRVKEQTTEALDGQTPVVVCSISSTLSFLNALVDGPLPTTGDIPVGSKPTFPPRFMSTVPPHVVGRFFLMQQYIRGQESHWWPYISTLPRPDRMASWALPAVWSVEDMGFLEGTNAFVAIGEIQANIKDEFKQARKILKAENFDDWQDYSRVLYNWAFCIFTSRSFRPSLVISDATKSQIWKLLPPGCDLDDFSILQPLFDLANHSPSAQIAWDTSLEPGECRLLCKDNYRPGQQIFNNYGQKTNSELLLGYGFILEETASFHNDYIHVRKRERLNNAESDGHALSSGKDAKPKDFLVSLRPMNDPASMAGRPRLLVQDPGFQVLPQFAHFEDALVWDIASAVMEEEERTIIGEIVSDKGELCPESSVAEHVKALLGVPTKPGLEGLVSRIKDVLGAKLQQDYEKLDVPGRRDEDALEDPAQADGVEILGTPCNRNQEMALAYRQRCRLVLEAAMGSLHS